MQEFLAPETLGRRIMILGPSNAGKSTLAVALGRRISLLPTHLDRLQHLPHTNWQRRPEDEFVTLHDEVIRGPEWIIDGGYSRVMRQRLDRATGIIVVNDRLSKRYLRYIRRSLFQKARAGALEGGQDSVSWLMLNWLWKTRNAADKYRHIARESGLPHIVVANERDLRRLYLAWGLQR